MSRILMIDPEDHLLEALAASPALAGHEIVSASGDVDALRRLRVRGVRAAVHDWVAARLDCSLLTAERVLRCISELRSEVPGTEHEGQLLARTVVDGMFYNEPANEVIRIKHIA